MDANASLEESNASMKSYKPLLDQYKAQVSDLEGKLARSNKETEGLKFEVDRTAAALKKAEEERDSRDAQQQELEMQSLGQELAAGRTAGQAKRSQSNGSGHLAVPHSDSDDEAASAADDSFDTNTMTQLRQQVRQLQRQVASAASAGGTDSNRSLVLQNLLEDANRMKARYESDYLVEMRAKLKAEGQLEEIRKASGKEDGPTTMALRLRLNELVEELDELKKAHGESTHKLEQAEEELVVARSNCGLCFSAV